MDQEILNIIGGVVAILGSIFLFLGSLGLVRMPDAYNRIQTGTKASTLGTMLSTLGLMFIYPEWFGKLVILILFVLITNPVSSHALARAAYHIKVPFTKKTVVDQLKGVKERDDRSAHLRKVRTNKTGE